MSESDGISRDSTNFKANPFYLGSSDNPSTILVSNVFNGVGFSAWKRSMILSLSAKNKLAFLDGSILPPPTTSPEYPGWYRVNSIVISWILNSLSKNIAERVLFLQTAHEIWNELNQRYEQSSGDAAIRICQTIENLVVEDKDRRKHVLQFSSSIFMVPTTLRNVSKESYTPRVVSIGPFHKEDTHLQEVEMQKVTYMRDLFRHLRSPWKQTMKQCVDTVLGKIERIKACYEGKTTKAYKDDEFAKMMVFDACFILEIIYRSNHYTSEKLSFFDNNLLTLYIKHDLLLLENQIPFFVLEDIFECTIGKLQPRVSLVNLVLLFLKNVSPFGKQLMTDNDASSGTNYEHILGLLQKCYHCPPAMSSEESRTPLESAEELSNPISYSVSELRLAGVKFKPNKNAKWVLAMEFKPSRIQWFCWWWGKPTFRMPVLEIEDYTEPILRNLVAYEQCSPHIPNYITSYVFAMERILDTKEDVIKVIESKVVVNNLGSSEQASDMINSLCKEVTVKDFSYDRQWKQLEEYYNGYWPKNVAWLRRTYFGTPWSFIALLAGFLLFGLTVAQTYFTIRPA